MNELAYGTCRTQMSLSHCKKRMTFSSRAPSSAARLDKYTRLQILFSKEALSGSYPVSHMAPPTPSASISVSVCGRSRQCFRSYPRNYTSVWLSAPTPGPQDVGTRYQTLIACRAHLSTIRYPPPPLPVWPALHPLYPSVFYPAG